MATYTTYEQVGKKEDVSNIITNIDPTKTPFQSSIKDVKVTNTIYQWQEDSLKAPALNAQSEGFTATDDQRNPTVMRDNRTQILSKTVKVSETADAISTYGRAKELAYQLANVALEIKRDLEYSMVGTGQDKAAGDNATPGSGTARTFAGYQKMIDASQVITVDSDSGTAGNQAGPLTEDLVLQANQNLYNAGAEATVLSVKPSDALKVANFAYRGTTVAERIRDVGQSTQLTNMVDLYRSPFGTQKVVLNRWQKSTDALLYDPQRWKRAVLRPWTRETLAKTGDSTTVMLVGEFGLQHMNFKASALITNLSA